MKTQNGKTYPQNYDVITKWMADALCGETLDVIGLKTGRIIEVFQFEPVEIAVQSGRVDIMIRDDQNHLYHLEEERNLSKDDMYRFAAYHFMGARKWEEITDVIIASGNVYSGDKTIKTKSGEYSPIVLDLSLRDGFSTLEQIRESVRVGDMSRILELVFVPLYGKIDKSFRIQLTEEVMNFERSLQKSEKLSVRFLAATLIMANKILTKEKLNEMWEGIKMLDVIEFAREKGFNEGKDIWMKEGMILSTREMLIDAVIELFGVIPRSMAEKIRSIDQPDTLKSLHRQTFKCKELSQFIEILDRLNEPIGHSA